MLTKVVCVTNLQEEVGIREGKRDEMPLILSRVTPRQCQQLREESKGGRISQRQPGLGILQCIFGFDSTGFSFHVRPPS